MNLYEINAEILCLLEQVDPETGELSEDVADRLSNLNADFLTMADNVASYIKNLEAEQKAIKDEEEKLYKRRRSKEGQISNLKDYLVNAMIASGQKKIETPRVKLNTLISQSVNVLDLAQIPTEYHRIKTIDEADKDAIKRALKAGKTIEGAELMEKVSITIK